MQSDLLFNARNGVPVPQDKQGRKYIPDILTLDDNSRPLRIKEGKLELENALNFKHLIRHCFTEAGPFCEVTR